MNRQQFLGRLRTRGFGNLQRPLWDLLVLLFHSSTFFLLSGKEIMGKLPQLS